MGLPGGWIADRLIGSQKAIWYGGIVIMCGHIVLAIPNDKTFFLGLVLVVLGTGLLKPNISAIVGQLYSAKDERRDSGYAIYYMGINIGSFIGYTVCGYLYENQGIHWAFGASAIGMALGLVYFWFTRDKLMGAGDKPFTSIFFIYFFWVYFMGGLKPVEKRGMWAFMLICVASTMFWSGFEQAGSSLNLFGQDFTNRIIGGFEIPTTWLQNVNPFFIITLTPLAADAASQGKVAIFWLVLTYFLHTVGELVLSPISLSAVSKLSPPRFLGQMMGLFVLTYSMGNIVAGLMAGGFLAGFLFAICALPNGGRSWPFLECHPSWSRRHRRRAFYQSCPCRFDELAAAGQRLGAVVWLCRQGRRSRCRLSRHLRFDCRRP